MYEDQKVSLVDHLKLEAQLDKRFDVDKFFEDELKKIPEGPKILRLEHDNLEV